MSNKMTQGFDEYWDKENVRLDDSYHKHKETYDLGAASRQAEIDELKKRLAMYERKDYKLVPVDDLHSIHNELAEEHPNYHLVFSILQKYLGAVE